LPSVGTPAATTTTTLIAQEATKCDNRLRLPGDVPFALPQVVYSLNASLSQLEAEQLEKCTRAQSKSDIWNNERKRRLNIQRIVPCQQFMEDMFMQLYRFHHGCGALIL